MYDRAICTRDTKEINDPLESMPSGHSPGAFFPPVFSPFSADHSDSGLGRILLPLPRNSLAPSRNRSLTKPRSNSTASSRSSKHRSPFWHLIAFSTLLLGAFLISGALTIDEFHYAHDMIAGGIIGSMSALASYRLSCVLPPRSPSVLLARTRY